LRAYTPETAGPPLAAELIFPGVKKTDFSGREELPAGKGGEL